MNLLIESDPEFPYLVKIDFANSGPTRSANKSDVIKFLQSNRMGLYVKKLETDGYLDVSLTRSQTEACALLLAGQQVRTAS